MKTIEDFKKQQKEKNIIKWSIHNCSMCDYECGFVFENDEVYYDSGCYCFHEEAPREDNWESVAQHYNRNQRENNPDIKQEYLDKMNKFWGFN